LRFYSCTSTQATNESPFDIQGIWRYNIIKAKEIWWIRKS